MTDALFTPRALVRRLQKASDGHTAGGEKVIRNLIASGELPAAQLGRGYVIRWRDWLDLVDRHARERRPAPPRPTRAERTDRAVQDRLRRERGK
jgi:hypothetical protein